MSDISQGPDWWLASDGKWYPPTSLPAASTSSPTYWVPQQPASPPIQRSTGLSTVLTKWVEALFWVAAGNLALLGVVAVLTSGAFDKAREQYLSLSNIDTWHNYETALNALHMLFFFVEIALFVLLVIWTFQGHKAAALLHPGNRTWVKGWAVGSWFVPLAFFIMPKLVIDETEKIARAPRSGGIVVANWRQIVKPSGIGWIWWLAFLAMNAAFFIASVLYPTDTLDWRQSSVNSSYMFTALGALLGALSASFGVLYVRDIGAKLSSAGLTLGTQGSQAPT